MEDLIDTFNKGLNAFVYPQLDTKTNNLSGLGLLWEYCYEIYKKKMNAWIQKGLCIRSQLSFLFIKSDPRTAKRMKLPES